MFQFCLNQFKILLNINHWNFITKDHANSLLILFISSSLHSFAYFIVSIELYAFIYLNIYPNAKCLYFGFEALHVCLELVNFLQCLLPELLTHLQRSSWSLWHVFSDLLILSLWVPLFCWKLMTHTNVFNPIRNVDNVLGIRCVQTCVLKLRIALQHQKHFMFVVFQVLKIQVDKSVKEVFSFFVLES